MKDSIPSFDSQRPPPSGGLGKTPERWVSRGPASAGKFATARFVVTDGSLEALKWLGLVLMILDHTNKFVYGETLPGVFPAGRVVMPIFGFVLAYNLARPDALKRGVHRRMMSRLLLVGFVALPIVVTLNATVQPHNPWWPLNILFTLFTVVLLVYLIEQGSVWRYALAGVIFVAAGAFVEYFWMGILTCIAAWLFCREKTLSRLLVWILAILSLGVVNSNAWAVLAVPLVFLARQMTFPIARSRLLFYGAYPTHLALLLTFILFRRL